MSISRHYAIILPCITLSGALKPMDEAIEQFLERDTLTYKALISATERGEIDTAMQIIQKQPELIDITDKKGNTLLVIAALHTQEALVKKLVLAGASINTLEYAQIWGVLSQTPQSPEASRTLSFLDFMQSEGFLQYVQWKKSTANISAPLLDKAFSYLNNSLSGLMQQITPHHDSPRELPHQALYAAALDNNHMFIRQHSMAISTHKAMVLCRAASMASRNCANEYLALYILFLQA